MFVSGLVAAAPAIATRGSTRNSTACPVPTARESQPLGSSTFAVSRTGDPRRGSNGPRLTGSLTQEIPWRMSTDSDRIEVHREKGRPHAQRASWTFALPLHGSPGSRASDRELVNGLRSPALILENRTCESSAYHLGYGKAGDKSLMVRVVRAAVPGPKGGSGSADGLGGRRVMEEGDD